MLSGKITAMVRYKGEKEPRRVEISGAVFHDEAAIKAHFETYAPGSEFLGIAQDSDHYEDDAERHALPLSSIRESDSQAGADQRTGIAEPLASAQPAETSVRNAVELDPVIVNPNT